VERVSGFFGFWPQPVQVALDVQNGSH
jgi:hypothetical protein